MEVRERSSATGPPEAECEAPSAMSASQSFRRSHSGPGTAQRGRLPSRKKFRRVRLPQAPPFWLGSTTAVRRFHTPCPCGCEPRPSPPFFRDVAEQQLQRAVNAPSSRTAEVQVLPSRPCRQSVGSDASRWYREERSASLRAGSIFSADVAEQHTRRPEMPAGASSCGCDSLRPHQFFGGWWNAYTRVSETRGREPVQVRVLSRRPIFASSSSEFRRPVSQADNTGANPVEATNFRRVVQSEPSGLYPESR